MGLLKWLTRERTAVSRQDRHPDSGPQPAGKPSHLVTDQTRAELMPIRLDTDGRVSVVGESHYQPALKAAVGGRFSAGGYEDAIPTSAALIPEPGNRHDRNAVRVDVGGRTVGYLAREHAVLYQPPLLDLRQRGCYGWCPAQVTGGGRGLNYGIFLHLGRSDRLIPLNSPDGLHLLPSDRHVTVTREEHHQDVFAQVLVSSTEGGTVYVSLHPCSIERGKHSGRAGLEVRLNGQRVGELTKAMSDRYAPLVQSVAMSGAQPGCQAALEPSVKGWQIELRLPG